MTIGDKYSLVSNLTRFLVSITRLLIGAISNIHLLFFCSPCAPSEKLARRRIVISGKSLIRENNFFFFSLLEQFCGHNFNKFAGIL